MPSSAILESSYSDISLNDIFYDLHEVGTFSGFSNNIDLNSFEDSFPLEIEADTSKLLLSFDPVCPRVGSNSMEENQQPQLVSNIIQDDCSIDLIGNNYVASPSQEQIALCSNSLYLKWLAIPPERVNAISPSKLNCGPRYYGTPFCFSVELVNKCSNGKFIPFKAPKDIQLVANIYGKRKPKTGAKINEKSSTLVKLELNPVGKPLMVSETELSTPGVAATIKQGESTAIFERACLTCGSNAARSQSAPAAARIWDWDYYIKVEPVSVLNNSIVSVVSKHITTDSNRSQTREKKKRDPLPGLVSPPPAKKRAIPYLPTQNGGIHHPPVRTFTKVFSAFKSDLYDFTCTPCATPQNVC